MWLLSLSSRYARRNPVQTGLVAVCIAVTVSIPIVSRLLVSRFDDRLRSQAAAVPVVVGPQGSRFDLVLSTVFFRSPPDRTLSMLTVDQLEGIRGAEVIPISTLFTVSGSRLVCVGHGFYERVGLRASSGTLPLLLGDVTLGAETASRLGLGPGDTITTDRYELFDLSVPPPITLQVVGVLSRTGTSADDSAFASIETGWLIGGQSHGHAAPEDLTDDDVIAASDRAVAIRPTLETETTVTDANIFTIHAHAERDQLPISAVLVFADDPKPLTLASARFEGSASIQAVSPARVIAEMMETVVRVQAVFDGIVALLAAGTGMLIVLTTSLAARLRSQEFATLESIGAPRLFRPKLLACHLVIVAAIAGVLTLAIVLLVLAALSGVWII